MGPVSAPVLTARLTRRLREFTLEIDLALPGGILVLFGPSGAGKTRTLECLAGLERPDRGEIVLDGEVFFRHEPRPRVNLPPQARRIGYVVQEGALFPHLNLRENVAYGLRHTPDRGAARAEALLEEMGIGGLGDRHPREVSGGQQRRAAIARALAIAPRLLLLDEPFIHLDRIVRARLITDLRELVRARQLPAVIVTHEIEELTALADHVAVLDRGRLVQQGARDAVLFHPASCGVACLLGDVNVLAGTVQGERDGLWEIATEGHTWKVVHVGALQAGAPVELVIRAAALKVLKPGLPVPDGLARNRHQGEVTAIEERPDLVRLTIRIGNNFELAGLLPADTFHRVGVRVGDVRDFAVDPDGLFLYPGGG